ncbi:hypothetical protein HK097_000113 [Rhizophlyctis rosea]|uniref:Uncharacterized protein n=1 Tax=Rhizophlyctis rosea TaxID=64517 RepID=A0AAD5S5Z7_9FUNG|nr:hypothetical protein HK097_000113 [Rhizophlyctis rosea]
MGFFTPAYKQPAITLLVGAVGLGIGGGLFMIQHFLRNDPTLLVSRQTKRENPYPWLNVRPDQNLKLYDVNQMFEKTQAGKEPRPTYH